MIANLDDGCHGGGRLKALPAGALAFSQRRSAMAYESAAEGLLMGYTPLFDSLVRGTLCGHWPDIGLWPIVLSLGDRHGVVDVTPAFIAGVTGLAVADVVACMKRFCEPDAYSRSPAEGGARLALLDEHREWGWRIVNHGAYREKARKSAYDADRTTSGKDAERKAASRDVPRCPDDTRDLPLSDSDSDSKNTGQSAFDRFWSAYPKKVKKKNSEEIWRRKKLDAKVDLLLADVPNRIANDQRWLRGYIPDPPTYLNGERWNDDLLGGSRKSRGLVV